ncbi:MAG: triple tyrosine motif-containing protein [Gelidibacter sp.]
MSLLLKAQELPPIELYDSKDYGAENQNWSISQAENKFIYVANNKGLLEYNGAKWQLYPSPNQSIIRSVLVVNNRIYTGCYMDFGFWQRNETGVLFYTSLSQKLELSLIDDEQFWNIISIDDFVLFQSLNRIYIYDLKNNSFKIVNSEHTITKMFKVHGSIYYQKLEEGIFKIENGASKKICDDGIVKNNILVNIFNVEGNLLIETQEKGFYVLKNDQLSHWVHSAQEMVSKLSVYSSIQLENGNFVLGTISNGMVYLNSKGDFLYKINQTKGLGNNTVLSLFEDKDKNIWLGLDNGINSINIMSPFSIYNDDEGKLGTVYASIVFQNRLYLGTNQGLFFKKIHSNDEFTFIEGTKGQVWCLVAQDNTLFCGHNVGTFIINEDKAELIAAIPGTWNIKPYDGNPNILLQGNYNGINVLQKKNGQWRFRNKLEGFNISTKYFELLNKNNLFVSHEYKGVFELNIDDELTKVRSFKKDSSLQKGFNSGLVTYNNDILYTYEQGVFAYNQKTKEFQKDSILSTMFLPDHYTSGKLIPDDFHNKLWGFSDKNLSYVSPGKLSDIPNITLMAFPQSLRKEMAGYETISYLDGNRYLLGTSSGYVIIDLDKIYEKSYTISINTITNYTIEGNSLLIDQSKTAEFANKENNIEFTYSVAEFDKYLEADYQYQLKGYYDQWSEWSNTSSVLFKNLPHGEYVFNVRARVGNTMTSNTSSFSFNIEKPWYISNLMIALYLLSILLFSLLMHNLYKNYYKKQKEKLLLKNRQELELKQMESEQQLMQVENEKLQQDIDNKSRELAISTMSLIKKNEFLNTVKEELKNVDDSSTLKPVIKFIDKNINNTDDWKFFQEAFNNADKDFLKKIKSKHPSLTPNDLRLCAYLRLNLSSKEIAPLLNISPKSVEVKRYRLRKKMDLPHDYSLTNYILEM